MIKIIEGQPIGTYGLIAVKELPPIVHKNYKERQIEVICPLCNKSFQTDLRRLTKKDTDKKKAVRMCPECSAKYIAELNKIRGEQHIDDLSGKKFGKLTALYPLKERKRRSIVWHCKCDCGGTKNVIQVDLKRGHTTHCDNCGCNGGCNVFGEGKDLTGLTFGKLTPLYPTEKRKHGSIVWYCFCECGNYCYKSCDDLTKGHAQSCGCLVSKGESLLQKLFIQLKIHYQVQKIFDDCINPKTNAKLKFDFYLPDYNCCIEYDGIQHFEYKDSGWDTEEDFQERLFRDKIKNQYCKQHNISLIRIPYWDYDKINEEYIINIMNSI